MDKEYVEITVDFKKFNINKRLDIRVPIYMTIKEMISILVESYNLNLDIENPSVRIENSKIICTAFNRINDVVEVRNGVVLIVEIL